MAIVTREWEYRRSTDTIKYSVRHVEHRFRFPAEPTQIQCGGGLFMVVNVAAGGVHRSINCLVSTGYEEVQEEHYYHLQEEEFAAQLRSHYPEISGSDASKLTETFTEILRMANAAHCCPPAAGGFGISHHLYFKIQPFHSQRRCHALAGVEAEEFIVDEEVEEEEDEFSGCCPASRASIMELLKAASSLSGNDQGGECGICMEDIGMSSRKTLRMPCLHSFHCRCLLNWLDNCHSCPLCRYQMPAAQFQSDV